MFGLRRNVKIQSLQERLAREALRLRAAADKLPPGSERDRLERKARQSETASHMSDWLRSSGLRPPE
jgi:hypothetical protein